MGGREWKISSSRAKESKWDGEREDVRDQLPPLEQAFVRCLFDCLADD